MSCQRNRKGMSLILVLGILSLVTVLAAVAARSVRTGRSAARDAANRARASQLLQTALTRAIADIDASMQGYTYPFWGTSADAMSSPGGDNCTNIFGGEITNIVPRSLWADACDEAAACRWAKVTPPDGSSTGRIAWLVINASGLVDANTLGGTNEPAVQIRSQIADIADPAVFLGDLESHGCYQSVRELEALNQGLASPASNLFVASMALDPDVYFETNSQPGSADIVLLPKFRINDFKESADYRSDSAFMTGYFARVTNFCVQAGYSTNEAEGFAWNLVNELDSDRVPQGGTATPWLEPVVEAVPLVNEIIVRQVAGVTSPCYEVAVELWHPFHRPDEDDGGALFDLQVRVFSNDVVAADEPGAMTASPEWSFEGNGIRCTNGTDFICFVSPETSRIEFVEFTTNIPPEPVYQPLGPAHPLWILARVLLNGERVDEAMGYGRDPSDPDQRRYVRPVTNAASNPLHNHDMAAWAETEATIGAVNPNCDPWAMGGSGIPIFHRDGPMRRTGDLGCLPIPDIGGVWRDVDLLSLPGAMLPNLMTARSTNDSYRGLVCASTQQKEILRALFRSAVLGIPDGAEGTAKHVMTDADADTLADAIAGKSPFILADNLLLELGESPSYATWKPDGIHTNGNLKEDAIRGIFDWLTFRQNVFIVIAAAQVVPPGGAGVLAEQRCVAIVCRDAFTGACRIRSVRPVWR